MAKQGNSQEEWGGERFHYLVRSDDPESLFTLQREYSSGVYGLSRATRDLQQDGISRCLISKGHVLVTGETGVGKEKVVEAIVRKTHARPPASPSSAV